MESVTATTMAKVRDEIELPLKKEVDRLTHLNLIYREALEQYACHGLGKCAEMRLGDGTCLRSLSGLCGNDAAEALAH